MRLLINCKTAVLYCLDTKDIPLRLCMPYQYIDRYAELLFGSSDSKNTDCANAKKVAQFVCNDSFYTAVNLIHNPKDVALACVLVAAKNANVSMPFSKYYEFDTFIDRVAASTGKTVSTLEVKTFWFKLLDADIDIASVKDVVVQLASTVYTG